MINKDASNSIQIDEEINKDASNMIITRWMMRRCSLKYY